mgnify:CR=1 FL=1
MIPTVPWKRIPVSPFVLPELKIQVSSQLYRQYDCLQYKVSLKRREEDVYTFDEDMRELADSITLSDIEVSFNNWT